ncbi:MAG: MucB/RseB C-terminal domain-containing protein [Burkholderiaceae bacterium]
MSAVVFSAVAFTIMVDHSAAADAVGLPADTAAWVNRIQQAAQRQNYAGTFVHQQGSQVQSSRVTHVTDRSGEHEKLELMDGQAREFIRHNDDVRCYMADSKLVLIEKRARYDSFPALLTSPPIDLDQYYQLSVEGTDRVAGRNARLIVLQARDKARYGYRLWVDRDTFLLLKAQTVDDKGVAIEQVAFTDVAIGGKLDASRIRPTVSSTDGWRTETDRMVPVDLARAGWSVPQPVAGFRKVMEVRRAFGGREDIGQMVYSDGLAAISIFIEPAEPHDTSEGEASKGPVNVVTERHGDFWLTIVGDAPASSVRDMARQISFKSAK